MYNIAIDYINSTGQRESSTVHSCPLCAFNRCSLAIDTMRERIPRGGRLEIYSIGDEDPRYEPIDVDAHIRQQRRRELDTLRAAREMGLWSNDAAKRNLADLEKMEEEGKL